MINILSHPFHIHFKDLIFVSVQTTEIQRKTQGTALAPPPSFPATSLIPLTKEIRPKTTDLLVEIAIEAPKGLRAWHPWLEVQIWIKRCHACRIHVSTPGPPQLCKTWRSPIDVAVFVKACWGRSTRITVKHGRKVWSDLNLHYVCIYIYGVIYIYIQNKSILLSRVK